MTERAGGTYTDATRGRRDARGIERSIGAGLLRIEYGRTVSDAGVLKSRSRLGVPNLRCTVYTSERNEAECCCRSDVFWFRRVLCERCGMPGIVRCHAIEVRENGWW